MTTQQDVTQGQEPRILIHDRQNRGHTDIGWLNSHHTFSFGDFNDPNRRGFKTLRVINDDIVAPGGGFATHAHRDMEIISYVLDGGLEHKDSLGTGSVIKPGEIQRMTAGTGVEHSEFNHSNEKPVHFYQIWVLPEAKNLSPSYEQKTLPKINSKDGFVLVGDREGTGDAITIHQDIKMYVAKPEEGESISYSFEEGRAGFIQIARGQIMLGEETLKEGDGVELENIETLSVTASTDAEIILFDLT